jgi:hypothetical protein
VMVDAPPQEACFSQRAVSRAAGDVWPAPLEGLAAPPAYRWHAAGTPLVLRMGASCWPMSGQLCRVSSRSVPTPPRFFAVVPSPQSAARSIEVRLAPGPCDGRDLAVRRRQKPEAAQMIDPTARRARLRRDLRRFSPLHAYACRRHTCAWVLLVVSTMEGIARALFIASARIFHALLFPNCEQFQ